LPFFSAKIRLKAGKHPFRLYRIDKDGANLKPFLQWSGQVSGCKPFLIGPFHALPLYSNSLMETHR